MKLSTTCASASKRWFSAVLEGLPDAFCSRQHYRSAVGRFLRYREWPANDNVGCKACFTEPKPKVVWIPILHIVPYQRREYQQRFYTALHTKAITQSVAPAPTAVHNFTGAAMWILLKFTYHKYLKFKRVKKSRKLRKPWMTNEC